MDDQSALSAKGVLEIEAVLRNAKEVTRDIALLREGLNDTSKAGDQLEKKSRAVEKGLEGVGRATTATTTATRASATATQGATTSLIAQRYALYDVATTYGIISAALIASAGYAVKLGADFESAFTNVQRTSNSGETALAGLRQQLVDLSTQAPLTFAELSKIATLGNQLGIGENAIASFTETVQRFATVTGLSVETASTAFGSLGELLNLSPGDYEKLGSAIAYVGRNSVATEAEIVSLTTRLAASATKAGFTAQEVVALAGALSSLRVAPERAQGVLEIYFNRLNTALADGGDSLQAFATVAGVTVDQVQALARTDPNAFFRAFSAGLGKLDAVGQTAALEALGLSGIRAGEVFGRVAGNIDVFDKALADSNSSYAAGTELADQYAKVVDDLNSQWMIFVNSVNALVEALSGGAVSGLAELLGQLSAFVNTAREFADNPIIQAMAQIGLAITALIGVFFAYRAGIALATASTFALITAQQGLAANGLASGLKGLVTALSGYTAAAGTATGATTLLSSAIKLIPGALVVALIAYIATNTPTAEERVSALADQFQRLAAEAENAKNNMAFGSSDGGQIDALTKKTHEYADAILAAIEARQQLQEVDNSGYEIELGSDQLYQDNTLIADTDARVQELNATLIELRANGQGLLAGQVISQITQRLMESGLSAAQASAYFRDYRLAVSAAMRGDGGGSSTLANELQGIFTTSGQAAQGFNSLGSSASGAAAKVRTLVDYGNDLSGVFKRAFDIRFSGSQGLDAITSGWSTIKQAISDTNDQIDEYQATMMSLTADRAVKEYWLSQAENYGDALRAGVLRGELADLDKNLNKTTKDLTKAQDRNSKTLVGNTDGAIANRAEILGLVTDYQGYIAALATSGLSQDDLRTKAAQLKADFIAQATQLGYNQTELQQYAASFDDVAAAINAVPRDISVEFNGDPALQAINEFIAQARSSIGSGISVPVQVDDSNLKKYARGQAILASLNAALAVSGDPNYPAVQRIVYSDRAASLSALYNSGNYWTGGYTGDGGKYEPKGVVHGGEFVFSKKAVQNIGVANLAYQHNMAKSGRGFAEGGYVGLAPTGGSGGVVQLSATDRQLLVDMRRAIDNKPLLEPSTVAAATGASSSNNYRRGAS